jgi:hypothetical protein
MSLVPLTPTELDAMKIRGWDTDKQLLLNEIVRLQAENAALKLRLLRLQEPQHRKPGPTETK